MLESKASGEMCGETGTSTADPPPGARAGALDAGGCLRRARSFDPAPPRLRGRGLRPSCSWLRPFRRKSPPSRRTPCESLARPGSLAAPFGALLRRVAPYCGLLRFIAIIATNRAVYCALLQVSSSCSPVRALDTLDLPGRPGRRAAQAAELEEARRRLAEGEGKLEGLRRELGRVQRQARLLASCCVVLRLIAIYCDLLRFIATDGALLRLGWARGSLMGSRSRVPVLRVIVTHCDWLIATYCDLSAGLEGP